MPLSRFSGGNNAAAQAALRDLSMTNTSSAATAARVTVGTLALLMALTGLGQMATNLVVPSLNSIGADLSMEPGATGLILSAVLIGIGVGQLVVGPLSDRHGRRPVLIGGLVLYILAGIGAVLATTAPLMLLMRLIQGLGASAGLALPRAIARDRVKGETFLRVMSMLTLSMAIMPGLAPMLGGLVEARSNWRVSLAISAASGFVALLAVLLALPESHRNRMHGGGIAGTIEGYRHVLRGRAFLGYTIATGCAFGGSYSEVAAALRIYQGHFGWEADIISLIPATYALGFVIGGLILPRLGLRPALVIPAGMALMVAAPLTFLALTATGTLSPWTAMGLVVLSQIGVGCMAPASIGLGLFSVEGHAGTASAVMGAGHMGISAIGAALIGAIPLSATWSLPLTMLGFALLATLAVRVAMKARPPMRA